MSLTFGVIIPFESCALSLLSILSEFCKFSRVGLVIWTKYFIIFEVTIPFESCDMSLWFIYFEYCQYSGVYWVFWTKCFWCLE